MGVPRRKGGVGLSAASPRTPKSVAAGFPLQSLTQIELIIKEIWRTLPIFFVHFAVKKHLFALSFYIYIRIKHEFFTSKKVQ
ncbi:MAG: hypothetical protein PHW92_05135 [Lutibacter sp.]|nr:hypothetical protein [Lutibacter sp.]